MRDKIGLYATVGLGRTSFIVRLLELGIIKLTLPNSEISDAYRRQLPYTNTATSKYAALNSNR